MTTPEVHDLDWAKKRALHYVTQDRTSPRNALATILSDLVVVDLARFDDIIRSPFLTSAARLVAAGDTIGMRHLIEQL